MRILLVEDDESLGSGVRAGLSHYGYTVDWLKDGLEADRALASESFDVVVLDLCLPGKSGLEVLKEFRSSGNNTPVLILTAKDTIEDRVEGLDLGADDYLTKPFDLDELCARIRALQRRHTSRAVVEITYGRITLDPSSHTVMLDDELVTISRREFALLHKLLETPGRAISREQLSQSIYGWEEDVDSNALEVHIHNLRKKFWTELIRTIRGVGYMIEKEK